MSNQTAKATPPKDVQQAMYYLEVFRKEPQTKQVQVAIEEIERMLKKRGF